MRLGYLQGVLEAEAMLKEFGGDTTRAYHWLNREAHAVANDYRWSNWLNGANDYLTYFIKNRVLPLDITTA